MGAGGFQPSIDGNCTMKTKIFRLRPLFLTMAVFLLLAKPDVASARDGGRQNGTGSTDEAQVDTPGLLPEPRHMGKGIAFVARLFGESDDMPRDGFYPEFGHMITGSGWISSGRVGHSRHSRPSRAPDTRGVLPSCVGVFLRPRCRKVTCCRRSAGRTPFEVTRISASTTATWSPSTSSHAGQCQPKWTARCFSTQAPSTIASARHRTSRDVPRLARLWAGTYVRRFVLLTENLLRFAALGASRRAHSGTNFPEL